MEDSPKIVYPCQWTYAILAEEQGEPALRKQIENIIAGRKHTLTFSKRSPKGNYISLHLEVYVRDQEERDLVFRSLKRAPGVKVVI